MSPPQRAPARLKQLPGRVTTPLAIALGALGLRLISGVGFANYDTLYALVWGQQLGRGQTPQYGVALAPTPHPLVEAFGLVFSPLGPSATETAIVWVGFVALSACGWVVYRLGEQWFGRLAGGLAAAILLTRVPVLSYGVRAYVDVPYLALVLGALLIESRRSRAGAPVLGLLACAGLLRPEAWAFSGLYWVYLAAGARWGASAGAETGARREAGAAHALPPVAAHASPPSAPQRGTTQRGTARLAWLGVLAAAAPLAWGLSDLLVSGDALWSLTNTRDTAQTLARPTGIGKVPIDIPRRVGEILRVPVLVGAALGGGLSLLWLPRRARLGAVAGVLGVLVFAVSGAAGLPINTRYAFLIAAILCVFCGAGVFGWVCLEREDPRRRRWMLASAVVLVALGAYIPAQYRTADRELGNLRRQQSIQNDLVKLVESHAVGVRCGAVGVPNHRPIPLLALRLRRSPAEIVSAQVRQLSSGTYIDPANSEVRDDYTLDAHDPRRLTAGVPPGFTETSANRSWRVFERCAG
ncbi:MAG TPA: hypothetical protein VLJ42_02195 [Solirubrobacteraceae bacterium]|nr:hypothetical protein [Solirubrobacteraceae bacterium]